MIRCYPIDGSDPFEVEGYEGATRGQVTIGVSLAAINVIDHTGHEYTVRGVVCRIESWRERAERLELELCDLVDAAWSAYGTTETLDAALDNCGLRRREAKP